MKPFLAEYLQKPSRPKPLVVEAYAGDITCIDVRIAQENPAVWGVIAIELIEHLYPDVLRGFELTVFGEINPEVVVVSFNLALNISIVTRIFFLHFFVFPYLGDNTKFRFQHSI